jgi:two-component system chemotaxis response regulator CheB
LKVLVVDDSALMRRYLTEIIVQGLHADVITARDGAEALAQVKEHDPDVVTLDVNMPVMDGVTCLGHIMDEAPRPVVMVSSITERDALVTLEALNLGAVDFVTKPSGTVSHDIKTRGREIVTKVRAAAASRRRLRRETRAVAAPEPVRPPAPIVPASGGKARVRLVLIGVSTGGPSTLEVVLGKLPADFPAPILIAQHMPQTFTSVLASRLDKLCRLRVSEVERRSKLEPGQVYIARGDADIEVVRTAAGPMAEVVPENQEAWHPCVDRMVATAMREFRAESLIGVLLTGMGDDGAVGMTNLRQQGGHTIAESEASATIFGMPRELIGRGGAEVVLPADEVADQLARWAKGSQEATSWV